jgi:hypothetical protein
LDKTGAEGDGTNNTTVDADGNGKFIYITQNHSIS